MGYKIGAVVEGSSDEDAIRAIWENLSKKLNTSLSLKVKVARGGKIKNKRVLEKSVEHLKVRGVP